MYISQEEREQAIQRNREIAQRDLESNLATAERIGRTEGIAEGRIEGFIEGIAEGRAEGRIEGRVEGAIYVAMNLFATSFNNKQIAELTGLTCNEIENIRYIKKRFADEWGSIENEIFTPEEMTASDLRVTVVSEFIKARNERSVS
jgi:flagellar biosynthesis/type III secretory pathway protein FliH